MTLHEPRHPKPNPRPGVTTHLVENIGIGLPPGFVIDDKLAALITEYGIQYPPQLKTDEERAAWLAHPTDLDKRP